MAIIGSVGGIYSQGLTRLPQVTRPDAPAMPGKISEVLSPNETKPTQGFGQVLGDLVGAVDEKQKEAASITRDVLMGKSDSLHQSVIAMQEAGVAFQLMVEVRNKVVESYQELMRMPV